MENPSENPPATIRSLTTDEIFSGDGGTASNPFSTGRSAPGGGGVDLDAIKSALKETLETVNQVILADIASRAGERIKDSVRAKKYASAGELKPQTLELFGSVGTRLIFKYPFLAEHMDAILLAGGLAAHGLAIAKLYSGVEKLPLITEAQ